MKIKLTTEREFDAAHLLPLHAGKCNRLHGHRWKVVVSITGVSELIGPDGILWDFGNLKEIVNKLDHRNLNEIWENPTAENIALTVCDWIINQTKEQFKIRVRVFENPKSYAEVVYNNES